MVMNLWQEHYSSRMVQNHTDSQNKGSAPGSMLWDDDEENARKEHQEMRLISQSFHLNTGSLVLILYHIALKRKITWSHLLIYNSSTQIIQYARIQETRFFSYNVLVKNVF